MQSCSSTFSAGFFLLSVHVLLVSTVIRVTSSQPQENTSQMKLSELDNLSLKVRHLIRRAILREPSEGVVSNEELSSLPDKRVFCNSFGGCTSLKRLFDEETDSDSVEATQPDTKRVFCNSFGGCRSFKRVSAREVKTPAMVKGRNRDLIRRLKLQPISAPMRVFCNSFGGCHT